MKRAVILIWVLFLAINASGQNFAKNADKIIIETKYTNIDSAMVASANLLLDNKIVIDVIDYKVRYITTKACKERINLYHKLLLRFSEEKGFVTIILSGQYMLATAETYDSSLGWDPIENSGFKGSVLQQAWKLLVTNANYLGTISPLNESSEISK